MSHLPTGKNLSLFALITASFFLTVVIILLPGAWFIQTTFEKKLIMQRLAVVDRINSAWTSDLNNHLNEAKKSIQRFSQTISNLSSSSQSETIQAFDSIVKKDEDGAWRSNQDLFSPSTDAGIWLQRGHPIRKGLKRFYIDVKEATEIFGQGALDDFVNTWLLPKEGGVIIYWPSEPEFIYKAKPDLDYTATEWVTLTKPNENPEGVPRWTPTSYDPAPGVWMISVVAPFFHEGKWAGSVGHDLPISKLIRQMDETKIHQGIQQFLIRRDGVILISSMHADDIKKSQGQFRISDIDDVFLNQYFGKNTTRLDKFEAFPQYVDEDGNRIFLINHIQETDWFFVSIVPRDDLVQTVRTSYRAIWVLGVFTLLLLAFIPAVIISRVVVPPVNRLVSGIDEVSSGDLEYHFKIKGSKEFSFIATALNNMVAGIKKSVIEIKTAEESLRESEEKYRLLLENIPQKIFFKNKDSIYVSCNENYARDLEISPNEITGKTDYDFYPKELADKYRADDQRVMGSGGPEEIEEEYIQEGKKTIVQTIKTAVYNNEGIVTGLLGVFHDITERKQTEEALVNRERFLDSIFTQSPFASWISDAKGTLQRANPALKRFLNLTDEQLVGKYNVLEDPVAERQGLQPLFRTVFEEGKIINFNCEWDGNDIPNLDLKGSNSVFVEGTMFPIHNPEGKLANVILQWVDISERKKTEKEKEGLAAQLRQAHKMEAIGTLAGGIAHDFNNILGIIVGNTELSLTDIPKWNPAHQNLEEVQKACLRARDVVRQLLSFSRKSEQQKTPTKIAPIIKETAKLLRASIPSNVDIRYNVPDDTGTIMAHPTQIHQVLLNLCTNAADAMAEQDGVLAITLDSQVLDEDAGASHKDLDPGPHVRLSVSDTGQGISPEETARIFDPYFTTKEVGKGTGLGLSVVHGIVKSHEGEIKVHSEPGKGTTFEVFFPMVEEETEKPPADTGKIPGGDERILFVDDEEAMAVLGKKGLERLGYRVTITTSAKKAIGLFRTEPDGFDLVISDMTMPEMAGDKLAKAIMETRPDMPVILCTGYSERISKEKTEEMGIRAFVMKPVSGKEMAITIRRVLDHGKEGSAPPAGTILVVDDDEQMRLMIRQMLEGAGYEVMEAPNGNAALWLFKEKPADLIITDIIMPEKEGLETITELKREFPNIRIIAISGGGRGDAEQYLKTAKTMGANSTLAKPFEKEELLKAVNDLLD